MLGKGICKDKDYLQVSLQFEILSKYLDNFQLEVLLAEQK